jgi:glycerol uptake facilitator-like aquaporin
MICLFGFDITLSAFDTLVWDPATGYSDASVNGSLHASVGAFALVFMAILHVFLFMFMVSSTIPGSGGHLNPLISMACVFARIMPISKCIVYIVCQVTGATIAGFLARLMIGEDIAMVYGIGGCGLGNYGTELGTGAAFLVEFVFSFILLFVIYGMVLDPRQNETAGPILGPLVVSLIFCFNFTVSGLIRPTAGYGGAAMNPARCLGPAIAMGDLTDQWVFWIPNICAAILHGAIYILVPPYHETLYGKLETKRKKEDH